MLDKEADKLKQEVVDDYATEIASKKKGLVIKTVNKKARILVNTNWEEEKLSLVPGKRMISILSRIYHKKYHVAFSSFKLARNMNKNDIEKEVREVLDKLEANLPFD